MLKEKQRKLTPAEEKRLAKFNSRKAELEALGYAETQLTVGIVKANIFAILLCLPIIASFALLYGFVNKGSLPIEAEFLTSYLESSTSINPLIILFAPIVLYLIGMTALVVVHELIHGITWSIFTPNHFKDIEFGFIKANLTPYCYCYASLFKGQYLAGVLMPLIILGIIPSIIAMWVNSVILLAVGIIMIASAGGDILVAIKILTYKSDNAEKLYNDHPTQAGVCIFEKRD